MNEPINIYIDMDGVQTVYSKDDSVEEMMEQGYFSSRAPHTEVINFIKKLMEDERFTVTILSAVFTDNHSVLEKMIWLEKQSLGSTNKLFVPCGVPKSDFIKDKGINVLIDDYSRNLFEWERAGENFLGIKFLNEANGENGTWRENKGATLNYRMNSAELLSALEQILRDWSEEAVA